jgi:hypothetical protein
MLCICLPFYLIRRYITYLYLIISDGQSVLSFKGDVCQIFPL